MLLTQSVLNEEGLLPPTKIHPQAVRVGCSTITFRGQPRALALDMIAALGITDIDLGAIPAVCDHVPVPFDASDLSIPEGLRSRGLVAGAINADVGDLNDPDLAWEEIQLVVAPLIGLAESLGAALILPCGAATRTPFESEGQDLDRIAANLTAIADLAAPRGVRVLVEALHFGRFSNNVARANALLARVDPARVGLVFDVSHVVAAGDDELAWAAEVAHRVDRVHIRDAVHGNINLGVGRGRADFAGVIAILENRGYTGTYVLELETHDIADDQREHDAARSRDLISALL